eukprot:CAMPEP_0171098072 /NCGR_PEP_ID=MMETSP0766_2-20121228/47918_1 /TAXON_ID=439317 /ORGANISM="Gambierdiscus australes, Strain CAWD 149" /LENGTH=97 /DNA_ID=CAMNT_0011557371 /DNA_START=190 /DNA_END=483 /DNA_ORIENTATION=-
MKGMGRQTMKEKMREITSTGSAGTPSYSPQAAITNAYRDSTGSEQSSVTSSASGDSSATFAQDLQRGLTPGFAAKDCSRAALKRSASSQRSQKRHMK